MSFEDLEPGSVVAERRFEGVDGGSLRLATAIFRDPNPIHYDRAAAAEGGHPGRVVQGPITASHVVQTALSIADGTVLRTLDVQYRAFVYEDEAVTATAILEELRNTGEETLVDLGLELRTDDGVTALEGTATVGVDPDSRRE